MFRRSISGNLAIAFALAALCIALSYAVCLRESLRESLTRQMHNELQFRESLIEPLVLLKDSPQEWSDLRITLGNIAMTEEGRVQYWITSADPAYQLGGAPPAGIPLSALKEGFSRIQRDPGKCPLYLLMTTLPPVENRPALRFIVAIDSTPYMSTFDEFTRVLIFTTTLGVLLVALLGFIISRQGMRPIQLLSQQAHRLAPGAGEQRLSVSALPHELHSLADAFNGVLLRQETAWKQLESFNANVAHELRTPLTNLIGQTQFALSRTRTAEQLAEFLESNLEEMSRMTSIVNDMLFLSHAQTGEFMTQLSAVSLYDEAQKTAEYIEPSFTDRNLELNIEGEVTTLIDRRLFHRALANLLENSARYAYKGTLVTVNITQTEKEAVICVNNRGAPIESQHIERLFERFYRVDLARAHSRTNHGLGLSIVKAIAFIHGGRVFVSSHNGINTFGFTVSLWPKK